MTNSFPTTYHQLDFWDFIDLPSDNSLTIDPNVHIDSEINCASSPTSSVDTISETLSTQETISPTSQQRTKRKTPSDTLLTTLTPLPEKTLKRSRKFAPVRPPSKVNTQLNKKDNERARRALASRTFRARRAAYLRFLENEVNRLIDIVQRQNCEILKVNLLSQKMLHVILANGLSLDNVDAATQYSVSNAQPDLLDDAQTAIPGGAVAHDNGVQL